MPNPKRPTEGDENVIHAAVDDALPHIQQYLAQHEDFQQHSVLREALIDLLYHCTTEDGYDRAKYLDQNFHWKPDAELVELLDKFPDIRQAYRGAIASWVKAVKIEPTLPVGARVPVRVQSGQYQGTIARIENDHGEYMVRIEALGHVAEGQIGIHGYYFEWESIEGGARFPQMELAL